VEQPKRKAGESPLYTDKELDLSVAAMLRLGVSLAALVVLLGGVLYLRHPLQPAPGYTLFHAAESSVPAVLRGAVHLDAGSMIQLGLLLLIATPVARVVLCVVGFARQHDRLYVALATLVLAILLFSLVDGGR